MKQNKYKRPISVLVVVYARNTQRVLMLQRRDDPYFWQSVTGSLEGTESLIAAATREVQEELGIVCLDERYRIEDLHHHVIYEIFPHFRHRYPPEVTHNKEHWFSLALPNEQKIVLSEHLTSLWMDPFEAMELTKSPSNRQAIAECMKIKGDRNTNKD